MEETSGTAQAVSSSTVPADHPGINELFTLLAYGEVAAFYRLTEEARMAPDLRGRVNMARMAAAAKSAGTLDAAERLADLVLKVASA